MDELNSATENLSLDVRSRIEYDKLTFFYLSMPIVLIGHLFGALLLIALLFGSVNLESASVWLAVSIVLFLYRFYHYYQFKSESEIKKMDNSDLWMHRFYSDVLLSGLVWGSSAILIFPEGDIMSQMIIILFIFAMSYTSMGNLAAKAELLLLFALISFVPLIARLLILGTQEYTNLGMIVIALMIILVVISRYFGNVVNNSLANHQHFIDMKHSHEVLQERFFSLFERAPVSIFYYNKELEILDSNAHFLELSGAEDKENLLNHSLKETKNSELLHSYMSVFDNNIGEYRGPYTSLISEKLLYVDLSTVPLLDGDGHITGGITILKDITEEVNAKESMVRNAYYDILTNIPNRTLLMDRLSEVIEKTEKKNASASILYIDLDNFKKLNETFGHDQGDLAIKQVAKRIQKVLDTEEFLARLGGDKFAVILPQSKESNFLARDNARRKAQKILDTLSTPLKISGQDYYTGASIGAHIFPYNSDNAYDVLKRAETAMYEVKRSGRNQITFYEESMSENIAEYISIDNDLRNAIANDELAMYYQPQIDVQSGEIIAAEALIRWNHPTKGMISPEKFIPIAEESGYIMELSHWIMERVVKDIKDLSELPEGFPLNHIAININSLHFLSPTFSKEIKMIIEKHQVLAKYVEIEITEGVIMENIDEAVKKMNELKEYGMKFSMDDFGTGYSSLSYLSQIPFDTLKIDQAFIMRMADSHGDAILVYSIINLAKNFDLEVVAEGVETTEILEMLQDSTCNIYQGYLAHKAMPLEKFTKLIR